MGDVRLIDNLSIPVHYNLCGAFFLRIEKRRLMFDIFNAFQQVDGVVIATIILVMALAAWKFWLDKPSNPQDVVQTIVEAAELADVLVSAAEQLWRDGRLPADKRFEYVMNQLQVHFPAINTDHLEATIESAVYWLKVSGDRK
jgi:hypothetical protein